MPTSDEDLQKLKDKVESLREAVRDEDAKRLEYEASLANDIVAEQLTAEKERLELQLSDAKASNSANAKASLENLDPSQSNVPGTAGDPLPEVVPDPAPDATTKRAAAAPAV